MDRNYTDIRNRKPVSKNKFRVICVLFQSLDYALILVTCSLLRLAEILTKYSGYLLFKTNKKTFDFPLSNGSMLWPNFEEKTTIPSYLIFNPVESEISTFWKVIARWIKNCKHVKCKQIVYTDIDLILTVKITWLVSIFGTLFKNLKLAFNLQ